MPFYRKPLFWSRAYFIGSVGGATLDTVRAYVEAQGTEEKRAQIGGEVQNKVARLTPSCPVGLAY